MLLDGASAPSQRLPRALIAWSRLGRWVPIQTRLRVSRRLSRSLLVDGTTYRGSGGFAFAIDRNDPFQATMLLGLYDPLVESILRRYTPVGGIIIDAQAHLGYFSLRFARWVGPTGAVHAFECDPRLVPRLRRQIEANEVDWVTLNECGLLDRDTADVQLYLPPQLGWASTLEHAWDAKNAVNVSMVTLDSYVQAQDIDPDQLSLIKLDVEGCELQALRGGRSVLAATSAPVLVEYIPERMRAMNQDPNELLSLMRDLGFEPWSPIAMRGDRVHLAPGAEPRLGEDVLFLKSSER